MSKSLIIKLIICILVILLCLVVAMGVLIYKSGDKDNTKNQNVKTNTNTTSSTNTIDDKPNIEKLETTKVPNLIGKTEAEAKQMLSQSNLKHMTIITAESDLPNGVVLKQDYEVGATVPKNTVIYITINDYVAPDEPEMPQEQPRKIVYYKDYLMVGYIEIPKIGLKYPVLEHATVAALEESVAVMYPNNPTLNVPGNVIIMGHNYRNKTLFSDVKKLSVGDKIIIEDLYEKRLSYVIYEMFETDPGDTTFMTRELYGGIEITLSTCTDDGASRLIVKAKAE